MLWSQVFINATVGNQWNADLHYLDCFDLITEVEGKILIAKILDDNRHSLHHSIWSFLPIFVFLTKKHRRWTKTAFSPLKCRFRIRHSAVICVQHPWILVCWQWVAIDYKDTFHGLNSLALLGRCGSIDKICFPSIMRPVEHYPRLNRWATTTVSSICETTMGHAIYNTAHKTWLLFYVCLDERLTVDIYDLFPQILQNFSLQWLSSINW